MFRMLAKGSLAMFKTARAHSHRFLDENLVGPMVASARLAKDPQLLRLTSGGGLEKAYLQTRVLSAYLILSERQSTCQQASGGEFSRRFHLLR